jgi:AbrB family looped-hinge helix DNA binding protein
MKGAYQLSGVCFLLHLIVFLSQRVEIYDFFVYNISKECKELFRGEFMEIAKITSKGQITIPVYIRRKLNLKDGDKVIFIEDGDKIFLANSAKVAFLNAQEAFVGEADRLGLKDEQDVVNMVDDVRKELWDNKHENNA